MSLEKKILHLVVKNGASVSKHAFEVETVIAGRNPDSPLPLLHKDVSRKHIGIHVRGQEVFIEDLGSTNGTFVNGKKLTPFDETSIGDKDDIWIGGLKAIQLKVQLEYFNLPKIEEARAEQDAADTMIFEAKQSVKPSSPPSFPALPKVPSYQAPEPEPEEKPVLPSKLPQNILRAPETTPEPVRRTEPEPERALVTKSDNAPSRSENSVPPKAEVSARPSQEELYLSQLERMKQKIILDTNNKAAEIIRSAKMDAELKTQEIYSHAQRSRKEAEEFYIKRIHEAGRAAEELQREAQLHSDELFQKTREQCESLRMQTTDSLSVMQHEAQKDCEKMYIEMEQQVRQSKVQRLADFDLSLKQKEKDYLSEIEKKNESKQLEFIEKIERKRQDHDLSLQEEREEFDAKIETELKEHVDKIQSESHEHNTKILRESQAHEMRIATELKIHTQKIESESKEHLERITREANAHAERIEQETEQHVEKINRESDEHAERIQRELVGNSEKIERDLEAHYKRLAKEINDHESKIKEESARHEERIRNESSALIARVESELEEHQQRLTKEKLDWQNSLRRSEEEWALKLAKLESSYQENVKKAKMAEDEHNSKAAQLEMISLELEKNQTFLKTTMTSFELARKQLEESETRKRSLDAQYITEKQEYEAISTTKKRMNDELNDLGRQLERERLALKDKLESEKARYTKDETEYSAALRQETLNQMKKVELELMTNIDRKKNMITKELLLFLEKNSQVVNTQPESWRKEREQLEKGLIQQFEHNIYGVNSTSSLPKDIDVKKQNRKQAFKQGGLGLVMGLVFTIGGQYVYSQMYGSSPLDRAVASQQEARAKDLEVRKFNPDKTRDVKDNYVDTVIYTSSFVEVYDSDSFQKEFSLAVSKQMLKLWKVDEDSSLQAVSISRALVKSLEEKKAGIHPDYVQSGIAKMRDSEKDARARMVKLFGTNVRYEAFKRMEKEYFERHRSAQGL